MKAAAFKDIDRIALYMKRLWYDDGTQGQVRSSVQPWRKLAMTIAEAFRRMLGRAVRWALRPPARPFGACGRNVTIMDPFTVNQPDRLFLGSNIYIGAHAAFNSVGGIRIGDGCVSGPFLHIYSANHRYEDAEALPFDEVEYFKPVDIGPNVWIGGDVVILPGVEVGEGAVVAAGAVVVKDVPPGAVVGGFPAQPLKHRDMAAYQRLKAAGRIINAMVGPGKNVPQPVGGIPAQWYVDAGLQVPPEAVRE